MLCLLLDITNIRALNGPLTLTFREVLKLTVLTSEQFQTSPWLPVPPRPHTVVINIAEMRRKSPTPRPPSLSGQTMIIDLEVSFSVQTRDTYCSLRESRQKF
ncbi:hypothetical protein RRG08_059150 [Elysia crispata]|uniref:Uncharacterized protein n=1 Tax=Elysia crispata TaxID=231223 RepID=A0AAE0ZVB8_9GAST|nr:hypothetical protein RRG08_059150 [Elysia crispata]